MVLLVECFLLTAPDPLLHSVTSPLKMALIQSSVSVFLPLFLDFFLQLWSV